MGAGRKAETLSVTLPHAYKHKYSVLLRCCFAFSSLNTRKRTGSKWGRLDARFLSRGLLRPNGGDVLLTRAAAASWLTLLMKDKGETKVKI
jgi:hypothetical protein